MGLEEGHQPPFIKITRGGLETYEIYARDYESAYLYLLLSLLVHFSLISVSLRKKCTDKQSKSPYSVQIRENTDQKNPEFGHFSSCEFSSKTASFVTEIVIVLK